MLDNGWMITTVRSDFTLLVSFSTVSLNLSDLFIIFKYLDVFGGSLDLQLTFLILFFYSKGKLNFSMYQIYSIYLMTVFLQSVSSVA